jgi:hypothetical protein
VSSFPPAAEEGGGGSTQGAPTTGVNSVAYAVSNTAPASSCPNGGITVDAGIDTNGNGVLDGSEVTSTQYVCNGAAGEEGLSTLVLINSEAAGANCAAGGKRVAAGQDANGNGILDAAEVTTTAYVCNGTNGMNGANSLVSIVPEAAGINCTYGGNKVSSGVDSNNNSVLDATEVTASNYVCDGAPGPGIIWVDVTGASVQAESNKGYLADNAASQVAITLPAAPAVGDIVQVSGLGACGWKAAQNAGQSIMTGNVMGNIGAVWTPRDSVRQWYAVASSADGSKLVAAALNDQLFTSTDSGSTWIPRESARSWFAVASSVDGDKLLAAAYNGQLHTSIDSGATWTPRDAVRYWLSVASSSDGSKLVAGAQNGLFTSVGSGATWLPRDPTGLYWVAVASSADGVKLVAAVNGGQLYTSTDSGVTWTAHDSARYWSLVASSADGRLAAGVPNGQLYTSIDSGVTWIARASSRLWKSVAFSADGSKMVAAASTDQLYTSIPTTLPARQRGQGGRSAAGNTIPSIFTSAAAPSWCVAMRAISWCSMKTRAIGAWNSSGRSRETARRGIH